MSEIETLETFKVGSFEEGFSTLIERSPSPIFFDALGSEDEFEAERSPNLIFFDAIGSADEFENLDGGAPPAAKSEIEALETFEVGSLEEEERRMVLVCAVCRDPMVMGEIWKKLPCGHCYHEDCIVPWLGTRNSCPVCRFQLRTDDANYESKRKRKEPLLTTDSDASSSTRRRSIRMRKSNRTFMDDYVNT